MKKKNLNFTKALSFIYAAVLAVSLLPVSAAADDPDPDACSLTVSIAESDLEAYPELKDLEIKVKFYKVADFDKATGAVTPLSEYASIDGLAELTPYSDADTVDAVSAALAEAITPKTDPDITVKDAEGVLTGAENGLYLVVADDAFSSRYRYAAKPLLVMLPMASAVVNNEFIWDNEATMVLKLERFPAYGDLRIVKTLNARLNRGEDVAFVFHVYATLTDESGNKTVVHDDVHTISFTNTGEKSIVIEQLPIGSEVTVTEVYSGRFVAEGTVEYDDDNRIIAGEKECVARFKNTKYPYLRRGSSVENIYEFNGTGYELPKQVYHYWVKYFDN